ncbi:MAG: UDP-N-acetylmuramate dehydrogenase [Desulfomonilaceae bacterium]
MTLTQSQVRDIHNLSSGRILTCVPLGRFTSFGIGGPADLVVEPQNVRGLAALVRHLQAERIPSIFLGAGTNVLFREAGFRGVVVRTTSLSGFEVIENGSGHDLITIAAGVPLPMVIKRTCELGWTGLEPLWGIPGSFGGAVVTNAGAGDACIGPFLRRLTLLNEAGQEIVLEQHQLDHAYRFMRIPQGSVVVEGALQLSRGDRSSIQAGLDKARSSRHGRQPSDKRSAGCVFKNPSPSNPAGALIERLGFKAMTVGDAQVSEVHANFIINRGQATARDVLELIQRIKARAKAEENIDLELEICIIGEEEVDG